MTSKTRIDRIPIELVSLADSLKHNLKTTKIDAYRKIAKTSKYNFAGFLDIFKSKKGNLMDLIGFGIIFLTFMIVVCVVLFGVGKFNNAIQANEVDANLRTQTNDHNTNLNGWFDWGVAIFFFLMLLIMIISNFFVQANIIQIIVYLFSVIFMSAILTFMHNGLAALKDKFPTVFANLPLSSFIVDAYYPIMAVFFLMFIVLLFARPRGEGISG